MNRLIGKKSEYFYSSVEFLPENANTAYFSDGLYGKKYNQNYSSSDNMDIVCVPANETGEVVSACTQISYLNTGNTEFSYMWVGLFVPDSTGSWTFYIKSDDASHLWIGDSAIDGWNDGNAFIDNGGSHGEIEMSSSINLNSGQYYPIRLTWGQGSGGDLMEFSIEGPGSTPAKTSNLVSYVINGDKAWEQWEDNIYLPSNNTGIIEEFGSGVFSLEDVLLSLSDVVQQNIELLSHFSQSTGSTISFSNFSTSLQQGDLVIILNGSDNYSPSIPGGWTQAPNNGSGSSNMYVYWKEMGSSPDASINITETNTATIAMLVRGANTSSITVSSATGSSGMPNCPSGSPSYAGPHLCFALASLDDDQVASSIDPPSDFELIDAVNSTGSAATIMAAYKSIESGSDAINPNAFTSGFGTDVWQAMTLFINK